MHSPRVAASALAGWIGPDSTIPGLLDGRAAGEAVSIERTVSLASFVAITEETALKAGDCTLGWALGVRYELAQLGPINDALQSARTLGAALRVLVDFFGLMQEASELSMSSDDGSITLGYRILDPDIWPRHQDAIFTLGILAQLLRQTPGAWLAQAQMGVESDDERQVAQLAQRSGIPCTAGCDANWLRFPAAWAELPFDRASTHCPGDLGRLKRLLVQRRRDTSIEERVRALVYRQLGDRPVCQQQIARLLGMSSRTLRRHLAASATSFQQLVDDCRLRQAAHELRVRRHLSIAQTALRLGYSEHSTFTRAFSRWSGMPPQSYIRAHAGA